MKKLPCAVLSALRGRGPDWSRIISIWAGKSGVLLELSWKAGVAGEEDLLNLAKDLAMQVAAAKPEYVRRDEVDQETLEKEKAIYRAQAINEE